MVWVSPEKGLQLLHCWGDYSREEEKEIVGNGCFSFFFFDVVHLARKESKSSKWLGESLARDFYLSIASSLFGKGSRESSPSLDQFLNLIDPFLINRTA